MIKKQILLILDESLELPAGTLNGSELLSSLEWNSLAIIGFIALSNERFGVTIAPSKIAEATTVNDLILLFDDVALIRES